MYLADTDIERLLPNLEVVSPDGADPFDPNRQIQPCSIDLRVSNVFWRPRRPQTLARWLLRRRRTAIDLRRAHVHDLDPRRDWKRVDLRAGDTLTLRPNETLMARVHERFSIPVGYAGKIEGRSSYARLGLAVHCTGDFINPGWSGFMPLQLSNLGPYPIRITPYLPLCQLILVQLTGPSKRNYGDEGLNSTYLNDDGGPSLWWRDQKVQALHRVLGRTSLPERLQQDVIELVRFESADVLERFEGYIARLRVGDVENADDVVDGFARREDFRKIVDRVGLASPMVLVPVLLGALLVPVAEWALAGLFVAAIGSVATALRCHLRSDDGYLASSDLRASRAVRLEGQDRRHGSDAHK